MKRLGIIAIIVACLSAALLGSPKTELFTAVPSRVLLDRRGQFLGESPGDGGELGYWRPPYSLPEKIVTATLEIEDREFFEHRGVSLKSIARALWQNVRHFRVISGGSTIAMQTARMQTPGARTLWKKVSEAVEALLLVQKHGHDQILRQYLTLAPYGNRVHGIVRAARMYFDKPVEDLSWLQASYLAALPQMPGRMNPYDPNGRTRGLLRAHRLLRQLKARGHLTSDELTQALKSDLGIVARPVQAPDAVHATLAFTALWETVSEPMRKTTLDRDIQTRASEIVRRRLETLRPFEATNSAALVVDPADGSILAYVGSSDYFDEEARGAIDYVQVRRSPGSALKPFVYALALDSRKFTAASDLDDSPMEIQSENGRMYYPENFNQTFFGPVLLREALGNSRNIPALRLVAQVGVDPLLDLFTRLGVKAISREPGSYGLSLAVGNLSVTLEELVAMYAVLAENGMQIPLKHFIDEANAAPIQRLPEASTKLITHILADESARRPTFRAGGELDYDDGTAVKTGTSQGFRDAWAIAYNPRLVVGVWVGNHDYRRMNHVTGQTGPAATVHALMDALMPERPPRTSTPSNDFIARNVCALSGQLAGPECPVEKAEIFLPGTEPVSLCRWHGKVPIDIRNGLRATSRCPKRFIRFESKLDLPARYATWARNRHLHVAPLSLSPLCGVDEAPSVAITEPRTHARYLWDPDTPAESASIRLAAKVTPSEEPVVFIVDGVPIATVGYPHETRWSPSPGSHVITAALARRAITSVPVKVFVAD